MRERGVRRKRCGESTQQEEEGRLDNIIEEVR